MRLFTELVRLALGGSSEFPDGFRKLSGAFGAFGSFRALSRAFGSGSLSQSVNVDGISIVTDCHSSD